MALRLDMTGMFRDGADGWIAESTFNDQLANRGVKAREQHMSAMPAWRSLHAEPRHAAACKARAAEVLQDGTVDAFIVLGIGGSALGASAMAAALLPVFQEWRPAEGRPRLFVIDSIDPDWLGELLDSVPLDRCHINVVSKSGGTLETASQFLLLYDAVKQAVGSDDAARRRFTITTDPAGGHFRKICDDLGFVDLEVPPGVGGRFSVLSPVGLFPAAVCGIDIDSLLEGAARTDAKLAAADPDADPALAYALAHVLYLEQGRNVHVHFPYAHRLRLLADWYQQLWAESLGKFRISGDASSRVGPTPAKAVGPTDQHSQVQLYAEGPRDKVITFLRVGAFGRSLDVPPAFVESPAFTALTGHGLAEIIDAERQGTEFALLQAGQPSCTLELCKVDAFHVGQYFLFFEVATAYAGALLGIDPYDQPGVEGGKVAALALMGTAGYEEQAERIRAGLGAAAKRVLDC